MLKREPTYCNLINKILSRGRNRSKNCWYHSSIFLFMRKWWRYACMMKFKNTSSCLQFFVEIFFFTLTYLTVFLWNPSDLIYLLGVICPYQPTDGKLLVCCYAYWAFLANVMATINFTDCSLNRLFFPHPFSVYLMAPSDQQGVDLLSQSVSQHLLVWKQRRKAGLTSGHLE